MKSGLDAKPLFLQVDMLSIENKQKLPISDQLSIPICLRNSRTALYTD